MTEWPVALGSLLAFLLHIEAQHRVDAALVARAFLLEVVEHIIVDADRDRFFLRRNDKNGFRPIHIERNRIRVVADGFYDLLIRQRVNGSPISLALSSISPSSYYSIFVLHFSERGVLR